MCGLRGNILLSKINMTVLKSVLFMVTLLLATSSVNSKKDVPAVIETPVECIGQRFCSIKPKGYDELEAKIDSVLPPMIVKDYYDRFGEETKIQPPKLSPKEDWHNCPYEVKTEQLYMINYGENSETAIIAQTKQFKQFVEVVSCAMQHIDTDSEEQCFRDLGLSAFGMKSTCQTFASKRTLYVYDTLGNQVFQKAFEVPVCCSCVVSYK